METAAQRELLVIGGDLALDFANTVDDPYGPLHHDHLGTYPEILDWSVRLSALSPSSAARLRRQADAHPRSATSVVRRAAALRQAITDVFVPIAHGASEAPTHWPSLRPFVTEANTHADLTGEGTSYSLTWPTEDLNTVLWPVAHAAGRLLLSDHLPRLKQCPACPWLFLDQSKNRSRRWCTMDDCGKNAKMDRYTTTRRTRRTTR